MAGSDEEELLNIKIKKRHLFILVMILVVIVILLLLRCCGDQPGIDILDDEIPLGDVFDLALDEEAGERDEVSKEEIVEELNRKVSEGMITISMNLTPTFYDGSSKGNLLIVNENSNNYPQIVQIYENATGRLLYESGLIPVGQTVKQSRLATLLPAGEYHCTACFHNIDPGSGRSLGMAAALIQINVLH